MPIVLEEHRDELTVVDGVWIPLVVSVGLDGLNTAGISKIARSVIMPLADFNISVYCLSTYKTDYVLVRKSDLAYACRVLAYDFKITEEKSITSEEVYIDPSTIPLDRRTSHYVPLLTRTHLLATPSTSPPWIGVASSPTLSILLVKCLFFSHTQPKGNESFFSLGIVDNDISLVLDDHLLHKFPAHILFNTREKWKMVKIGDMPGGLGFVTAGIVAQMSDPIASANISEYYISSYYYGHTLGAVRRYRHCHEVTHGEKVTLTQGGSRRGHARSFSQSDGGFW
ncbi:GATSL3 [Bugula neritina]|uniref:GATSL3 n=1 Tax=Bugula neritina TaxID=10212 RepID=A0A7J7KEI5_BUGNE|nr:GATSL3 [Bugula neritina]